MNEVRLLEELDEEAFAKVVAADVKGAAPASVSNALRTPQLCTRWHDALVTMVQDVDAQLTQRAMEQTDKPAHWDQAAMAAWKTQHDEYLRWRGLAMRFRQKALAKKREAQRVKPAQWESTLRQLCGAVLRHRLVAEAEGLEAEPHDKELWERANELAVAHDWWLEGRR